MWRRVSIDNAFDVSEQEASKQSVNIFGAVYLMTLYTWNFEYALALESMKTLVIYCVRHLMSLFMPFVFPNSIFSGKDCKKID